ncbi:MAG: NGG1p interacting factor NIF3 [Candidatus Omnitrophota bacterium]
MKLKDLYKQAVRKGLDADPRPQTAIRRYVKKIKANSDDVKGSDLGIFDKEALENPYYDTRILYGKPDTEIKKILIGIDIDVSELLLADRLREKGESIDLVISHHPSGRALAGLYKVMDMQPDIWELYGLSREVASGIMRERINEVSRGLSPANHGRAVSAARLLDIPFMCIHTPADNCVTSYLQNIFDKKKPVSLQNALHILGGIAEYKNAREAGTGPFILIGDKKNKAGRIFVDMTGGTSGPDKMFGRLSQSGVKTIIGMHCKETSYKAARAEFINYIIAGHIASDTLGMNLLFDHIEKKEKLEFIECSGFKRIRRNKRS